jgi:ABC-type multidrug transport system fused ATPase/permease subunit
MPDGPCELVARHVEARRPNASHRALRGVDLRLSPGRRVAVVGPSGAGKTTLAEVFLRFLSIEGGSVRLDGVSLEELAGEELRGRVGLVGQDVHLFDTTIAANLRIGQGSATDLDLVGVLGRVGLGPWVEGLPGGLATEVGRNGTRLSGGQRHRVALARALLADFPVLVVDEPAEHLDPLGADAVLKDLLEVTDGRSLLLITHRLSGLDSLDEIVVVDRGRIVERGSHAALVTMGGMYADLWWAQTGGGPEPAGGHDRSTLQEPTGHERPTASALRGSLEMESAPP